MRFIDTHCHILHGIDDGPAAAEGSLEMARIASREGTAAIIATPHVIQGVYEGADLPGRVAQLQQMIDAEAIGLRLHAGAEVPMSICLTADPERLARLCLAGSRYLLMETAETTFDQLERAAYQVRISGLFPVLAHPERVGFVSREPRRLAAILRGGEAFCQVTAASIEGRFGKTIRKSAEQLLRMGLVHLVASDAHRPSGGRAPGLSQGFAALKQLLGEARATVALRDNPRRVLDDEPLESISGSGIGIFSRFRRTKGA